MIRRKLIDLAIGILAVAAAAVLGLLTRRCLESEFDRVANPRPQLPTAVAA